MKKFKIIKYILLILILILNFVFKPINKILNKEINLSKLTHVFGKSLYNNIEVNNKYIMVIDYYIEKDMLYIFPVNGEIKLPFDVSVVKINKDYMEVIDIDNRYCIYNIDKKNKGIYQYVYSNDIIGYTNDFYIIESDNIEYISSKLIINHEAI